MPRRAGLIGLALAAAAALGWAPDGGAMQCKASYPEFCATCADIASVYRDEPVDLAVVRGRAVWTPLYAAYFHDCPDQARAFLQRGADPNVGGDHGDLLGTVALWDRFAEDRRGDWLALLAAHGARLDFVGRDGMTAEARIEAAAAERPDVARLLADLRALMDGR